MKITYRKTMPLYHPQAFREIINRMKTLNTAPLVSNHIYIHYSQRLKNLNSLQDISVLLSEMLNKNILPDAVIISQLINKMKQLNQLAFALELHGIAASKNIANAITYNSTISAIANSATPDASLALRLLEEAKRRGFANAITYASSISAIAKSATPDASLALRLLEEAKRRGFANAITYASTIDAIAKSATPDASSAFGLLEEAKRLGFADAIIYNSTISAIAKSATPDQGVSGKENQDNPGCLNLMIDSDVQSARHQFSALTQISIFPNTRNSSLNPNAKEFLPGRGPG
jgi:hypothetical protein